MKYMGSKRGMLENGLGKAILACSANKSRFVDLFSGTGSVSWFVAENTELPVIAVDLQEFCAVLARAVIGRTKPGDEQGSLVEWLDTARRAQAVVEWNEHHELKHGCISPDSVFSARELSGTLPGLIAQAYGGYYFSPTQAAAFDALLETLSSGEPHRSLQLAALIWAASRCVAAPGHTAQPLRPTANGLPFIKSAWSRDPFGLVAESFRAIALHRAQTKGSAVVQDAQVFCKDIRDSDLVFLDPPYSAAQYSRYYHVLETLARGGCGSVSGEGRYPPSAERPRSVFSLKSAAGRAISDLLASLAEVGCSVVMTFPQFVGSTGVSGEGLIPVARQWFSVDTITVPMRHSTLGGNNTGRPSRRRASELILCLVPR